MLCSTIIPTVNRATLARSVQSALQQELGAALHEILVFNNSPGELTASDWMCSPQVKIIDTHSNVNHASNAGAAMATGKYLHFLHDDDYLLPGALPALVRAAESSECFWVTGAYNLIDDDGNFMSTVRPVIRGNVFALLMAGECLHLGASVINRAAFLQVGGFDLQIFNIADLDLECQLALLSDFASIDQIVATIRLAGGKGTTHDWTSRTKPDFRAMREKALNTPHALPRMIHSVQGDLFLRGRACRTYLFSAAVNLLARRFRLASRRLIALPRLASYYVIRPTFWRGLFFKSYWHNIQKHEQAQYFKTRLST